MSEDAMRMSAVYKGHKFMVGDAVLYVDPDEVEHTLIITDITRVDGSLPTYYRVRAKHEFGWYWADAHERYFKFAYNNREAAWLEMQQTDH